MISRLRFHIIAFLLFSTLALLSTGPRAHAQFEDWKINFESNGSLVGSEGDTLYLAPIPGMGNPTPTPTGTWVPQNTSQTSTAERDLLIQMLQDLKDARDKQQAEYDDSNSAQYQKAETKALIDQMNEQIANLQTQIDALSSETINQNLTCDAYCAQKRDQLELILKDVVCMAIPSCAQCRLAFSAISLEDVETNTLHIGDTGQRCNAYQQSTKTLTESRNLSGKYHFAFATCLLSCGTSLGLPIANPFCDFLDFGILVSEVEAARASLNEAAATDPEVIDAIKSIGSPLFQQNVSKKTQGQLTEEIVNESAAKAGLEFAIRKTLLPGPCAAAAYIMWRMLQSADSRGKIEETKTSLCGQIEQSIATTQTTNVKLSACIVMACALQPGGCKNQNGPGGPNPTPTPTLPPKIIGAGTGDGDYEMGENTGAGAGAGTGYSPNLGLNPNAGEFGVVDPITGTSGLDRREITFVDPKSYSNLNSKERAARTATEERIREITAALDRNMDDPLKALREVNPNLTDSQLGAFQKAVDAVTPADKKKYSLGGGSSTQASTPASRSSGDSWGSGGSFGGDSGVESISGTLDLLGAAGRKLASIQGFENGIHTSRARTIFEIVSDQYESQVKQGKVRIKTAKRASKKIPNRGSTSLK